MDVNKVVRAIEGVAEHALPGLRESLAQANAGSFSRVHTPEQIVARRRGRPMGSKKRSTKEAVKVRLDADVMAALRASGDGWQTRINDALRAFLALSGKISTASGDRWSLTVGPNSHHVRVADLMPGNDRIALKLVQV